MREVTVDLPALRAKVRMNRDAHEREYQAAHDAYRSRAIDDLEAALAQARDGGEVVTYFPLEAPEHHTDDYDTALAMLDMEVHDTVTLDQQSFKQYVLDQWSWSGKFKQTVVGYVGDHGEVPRR